MNARNAILEKGAKSLQDFGYPNCNVDNILTHKVYSAFFTRLLEEVIEDVEVAKSKLPPVVSYVNACKKLLEELQEAEALRKNKKAKAKNKEVTVKKKKPFKVKKFVTRKGYK